MFFTEIIGVLLVSKVLLTNVVLRQYLIHLNKKLEKGEAEAFAVSAAVAEKSAEYVILLQRLFCL